MRLRRIYGKLRQAGVSVIIVVVVLTAATMMGAIWPRTWPWLVPVAGVIAALAPWVSSQISAGDLQRGQVIEAARRSLRGVRGVAAIELPAVSDLTLEELGVHRAVLTLPYIHRDRESEIRKLLEARSPVLLVGSSMVGKTMTAAIVIKDLYSRNRIVVPDGKDASFSLDSIGNALNDAVIWLDDINFFIGAGGITGNTLRRLAEEGSIIIATIRSRAYNRYIPSSEVKSPEWDVIKSFKRVFLERQLSAAEEERIAAALDDEIVKARILRVGLGEYVGAAELIDENLKLGPSVSPIGYALVRGAADWRRAGIDRPIPGSLLPLLASPYLEEHRRFEMVDSGNYAAALAWATHEINEEVSLLRKVDEDSFAIFDYALDLILAKEDDLPEATWAVVIGAAAPSELLSVGYTAWVTFGIFERAFEAWSRAAKSEDGNVWPKATYNIAYMLEREGRTDEAEVFYERAIGSGDQEIAAVALTDLGYMRFKSGRLQEAKQIYERVLAEVEDKWAIALTYLRMGMLSEMQEEPMEARKWNELAVDSGYYDLIPRAEIGLAHADLLEHRPLQARSHFQKAINSGHVQHAPRAAFELANILIAFGQAGDACDALRIAIEIWNDDISPVAAGMLGQLLEDAGEVESALAAYETAEKSGHSSAAPTAALFMGKILEGRGDAGNALKFYHKALACDNKEFAAEASERIKVLTENQP